MSWSSFKSNLESGMKSGLYNKSLEGFAKAFTINYDITIKSGREPINSIPVFKGNVQAMEAQLISIMRQIQSSKTTTLLEVIGPSIITYWTGAKMLQIPPIIPAPGALKNIVMIDGSVLDPGVWTPTKVPPNNNPSIFLNAFINCAKLHLSTVKGTYTVLAQYPPPTPPAPGVLPWSSYLVS